MKYLYIIQICRIGRKDSIFTNKATAFNWTSFTKIVVVPLLLILAFSFTAAAQRMPREVFDQGNSLYKQNTIGSLNQALTKFEEAYRLYARRRDLGMMALSKVFKGRVFKRLGKFQNARQNYEEAINLYRQARDPVGEASAYSNLGTIFRDQNKPAQAIKYFSKAVNILARQRNSPGKAKAYSGLADAYRLSGDRLNALPNYLKSIAIWRGEKNTIDKIRAYYGIALVYFSNGDSANSVKYQNEAFRLAKQRNEPAIMVEVLDNFAAVYDNDGQKDVAIDYRIRALNVYRNARGRVSELDWDLVVNNLADIYFRMGKLDKAHRLLTENIRQSVTGNQSRNQSYMVGTLGEVLSAQGKYREAIGVLNRAIELAQQAYDKHSEAYSFATLGIAYLGTFWGDPQAFSKAKTAFDKSLSLVTPGTDSSAESIAYEGLIFLAAYSHDQNRTIQTIKEAQARKLDVGNTIPAIRILRATGVANAFFGDHKKAIQYFEAAYAIAQKRKNVVEGVHLLSRLGGSNLNAGNYGKAVVEYQLAAKHYGNFANTNSRAYALVQLGWAYLSNNAPDQALSTAEKAVDLAVKADEVRFRMYIGINSLHIAGKAHLGKGEYKDALTAFNEAMKFAKQMNDKQGVKHFLLDISQTYQAMGNKKKAKKFRKKSEKIK